MIKDFKKLIKMAKGSPRRKLVVAGAGEEETLRAVKKAFEQKMIEPFLVGNSQCIFGLAESIGWNTDDIVTVDEADFREICKQAVTMVSSGEADILMKGGVPTPLLMKEVLDRKIGLRADSIISHLALVESSHLQRLLIITDGGMNIKPDLQDLKDIIQNAINIAGRLGYKNPKVAILTAGEKVNPDIPETITAAALTKMADRGQIQGGIVDGPLALDNALSPAAAARKNIGGPVAGKADILVVPDLISGNLLGKSAVHLAGDRFAGLMGGTSKPVIVASRASEADIKYISIAAAVLMEG
ncbi:MAG: bifunctional enoyl-CoA hydratase/phosphate acetyltransferase [Halanaerobiaceae bacterium]